MEITDLVTAEKRLPSDKLMKLAEKIDAVVAETVDRKLEQAVEAGAFDAMAEEALKEHPAGNTRNLDEIFTHNANS